MGALDDAAALLATSTVFSVLSPGRRSQLLRDGTSMTLTRGMRLFSRGDAGDACYLVLSGELEVVAADADGRDVWLASLGSGALIGEIAVLDGGARSADVTAMRRTALFKIRRDSVLETLKDEPASALALLGVLASRLRSTDARVEETALVDLPGRLARLLLQAGDLPVTQPQGEMARLIGASRERVNKTLAAWRERGWIEIGRSGTRVVDRSALAALTQRARRR